MYEPCTCAACMSFRAETPDNTAINGEVQRIVEQLWHSKKGLKFDSKLLIEQSRLLLGAMNNGYGKTLIDVAWNSPDFEMLANLTKNVYQFSAAKNYQELKDFTTAITDGDRIRSFSEYQTACNDINAKYNGSWLLSEYNQAIASSQMAGKWADFEANKKDMPMLKYQTIGDSNVRDSHARLDGIVKSIDDSFWNSYYPPNGWGCRCEVIQLTSKTAKATDTSNKELPAVPTMWQINVGKQGIVYPPSHAYYKDIPKSIWSELESSIKKAVNHYYARIVDNWMETTGYAGERTDIKSFVDGDMVFTKTSFKKFYRHLMGSDRLFAIDFIKNSVSKCTFIESRTVEDDPSKKHAVNINKKQERHVEHYNYYKIEVKKGDERYLSCEVFYDTSKKDKMHEKPYAITVDKPKFGKIIERQKTN